MRSDPRRSSRHDIGTARSGYLASGLPYNRFGHGPRPLIVIVGLAPDNAPLVGRMATMLLRPLRFLAEDYTVYAVGRLPNLPPGYTLEDMADDYARVVREELGGPIDVIGISTGGSIAQVFAVRHAELVRRLVVYSAAHSLGPEGRAFQRRCADPTPSRSLGRGHGRLPGVHVPATRGEAPSPAGAARPGHGAGRCPLRSATIHPVRLRHHHRGGGRVRLSGTAWRDHRTGAGVGGERDPFYTPAHVLETAEGIPDARLLLVDGGGHVPSGRRVTEAILRFLAPATATAGEADVPSGGAHVDDRDDASSTVWTASHQDESSIDR